MITKVDPASILSGLLFFVVTIYSAELIALENSGQARGKESKPKHRDLQDPEQAVKQAPRPLEFDLNGQHTLDSSVKGGGRFSSTSARGSTQVSLPLSKSLFLSFGLGGGKTSYHFEEAFMLDPILGKPVGQVISAHTSVSLSFVLTRQWSILLSVNATMTAEHGAAPTEGLTYGGLFGVSYRVSKQLQLGLGVFANTRLEAEARLLPIPLIRWSLDLSEHLTLILGLPDGVRLSYSFGKSTVISLKSGFGGALNIQDARLDDDGFAPGGVLRQTLIPISLGVEWQPLAFSLLSSELGLIAYRQFEIDDKRGRRLTEDSTAPAFFLSIGVKFRF